MIFETPTVAGIAAGNVVSPVRVEQTPTSYAFFSPQNVASLHTSIRYQVYQRTGNIIDKQGDAQLKTIMMGVYEDSQSPTMESAILASRGANMEIVRALNARVINRAVHEIISAMQMHQSYMDDISTPVPIPLDRSIMSDTRTGTKTLELPIGF